MSGSSLLDEDRYIGEQAMEIEQYAAQLDQVRPAPGNINIETSMLLVYLSLGDQACLKKLRLGLLREDLGSIVKALVDLGKHKEEDILFLQKAFQEDEQIAVTHALRRLAGDPEAGLENDEFKAFDGKGFVRRDVDGNLQRMPFSEEAIKVNWTDQLGNGWKSHQSAGIIVPPKEAGEYEVYAVCQLREDWEVADTLICVPLANISNAHGDLALGLAVPESGSMVLSALSPEMQALGGDEWDATTVNKPPILSK